MRLNGVRFGLSIAVLFFSCWSGFMFAVALTLQSGLGMTPFQSGNAFIALGTAYFIGSLFTTIAVEKLGRIATLLTGCGIQMAGLLVLIATFKFNWPEIGIYTLLPATVLIGFGQSFIVSCFFRIGLADVPKDHAGAGSAMLSTVQQAAFGLGPMLLGTVYSQVLQKHGSHQDAVLATLVVEFILMLLLVVRTVASRRKFQVQPG